MSIFQEIASVFRDKSNHIVVLSTFFVHSNSKVILLNNNVHFFSLFELFFLFKLFGLFNIKVCDFSFREIFFSNSQSLFPLSCFSIHFKSINWKCSLQIILFSEVILSDCRVMLSNLSVIRSCDFGSLMS